MVVFLALHGARNCAPAMVGGAGRAVTWRQRARLLRTIFTLAFLLAIALSAIVWLIVLCMSLAFR